MLIFQTVLRHIILVAVSLLPLLIQHAKAQTLLDDFNSPSTWSGQQVNLRERGTIWDQYNNDYKYGRTTFGNLATAGTEGSTNFIRLKADSTGGTDPDHLFYGAEL